MSIGSKCTRLITRSELFPCVLLIRIRCASAKAENNKR